MVVSYIGQTRSVSPSAIVALFLLSLAAASASITLHVDQTTFTLSHAQTSLRNLLAANNGQLNVTILLSAGTHRVPRGGLVITTSDTPSEGYSVIWQGTGATFISGGDNVTGWTQSNDPNLPPGVWRAPLPPSLLNSTSRQLYVDGVRASRTSMPVSLALPGLALEQRSNCAACSYTTSSSAPLTWSNPEEVEMVYTAVASGWSESRCTLESAETLPSPPIPQPNCTLSPSQVDCGFPYSKEDDCINNKTAEHPDGCCWVPGGAQPSGHWCVIPVFPPTNASLTRLNMKQPCFWNLVHRPWQPISGDPPITVENVREHLSTPGQWYLDRARGEILYFPLPGQKLADVAVVVAVEEKLVSVVEGGARQKFSGLTFSYATWLRPGQGDGFVEAQSAAFNVCPYGVLMEWYCGKDDVYVTTPGNVQMIGAHDVEFSNSFFTHLGAYAAAASGGSQRISWLGCGFSDISAGAVMLGGTDTFNITDTSLWDGEFTVADCQMMDTGKEFTGATTVFAAYVFNTTIEHNRIVNASYSGMTLGWGWGRENSMRGGNVVRGNHVQGVQTRRCCDGGGIYTLGPQPGSSLTENYIAQGTPANSWGPADGNGIYHDNGSGGFYDSENVIDGTWHTYFFQDDSLGPYGPGAVCKDNSGVNRDCGMSFVGNWMRTDAGGTTQHVNTTFANNTKVAPGHVLPPAAASIAAASGPRAARLKANQSQ